MTSGTNSEAKFQSHIFGRTVRSRRRNTQQVVWNFFSEMLHAFVHYTPVTRNSSVSIVLQHIQTQITTDCTNTAALSACQAACDILPLLNPLV